MKIEINNLGPISKFEFDFSKDLNIIFGKNNIGKSYAINVLYLILKNLIGDNFGRLSYDIDIYRRVYSANEFLLGQETVREIERLEKKVLNKLKVKDISEIDSTKEIENIFVTLLNQTFIKGLEKSLNNSFSSIRDLSNKFSNQLLSIRLIFKEFEFVVSLDNDYKLCVKNVISYSKIIIKKSVKNRKIHRNPEEVTIYLNIVNMVDIPDFRMSNIMEFVLRSYVDFRRELTQMIKGIYFLPASRSGLYQALSTFSVVIAELSKSRNFLQNKIELPNISEPVSDYFLYLSNIGKKQNLNKNVEVARIIEKKILNGEVNFNQDSKKIVFQPAKFDKELDLSVTSSMVSEIAPIVAFLKYVVSDTQKNPQLRLFPATERNNKSFDLIFIEEPEAHLHPEVQVLMMEMFAMIVKNNVKLIMTSHSNYMFNKLGNLILENNIEYKRVGSYLMEMKGEGSILNEFVMKAEKEGIEDHNFSDVAEKLYNERLNTYKTFTKTDVD